MQTQMTNLIHTSLAQTTALACAMVISAACGASSAPETSAPRHPGAPESAAETAIERTTEPAARPELDELLQACQWWDAEEAKRQPAVLCVGEDGLVPSVTFSLPAIANDGQGIAVLERGYDSFSNWSLIAAEIRNAQNEVLARWPLVDRPDGEEDQISAEVREARIAELNERLYRGQFRPMAVAFEDENGMEHPVALEDGLSAQFNGSDFEVTQDDVVVASLTLPSYERDSDCCDGGLGLGGQCQIPSTPDAIWKHGRVLVVSAGVIHQRDGCDSSPIFYVLELPAP